MDLKPQQRSEYTSIIDQILHRSDLNTISAKAIRKELAADLGYDVSEQKAAISALIMERFDKLSKATPPTSSDDLTQKVKPQVKGIVKQEHSNVGNASSPGAPTPQSADDAFDADVAPPPKKRKREQDEDAKLAARLQAEENSRARPSRGSVSRKPIAARKKSTPKKKSPAKIKKDDDSEMELGSDGEPKEKPRKGGFHKQYALSESLATLVGESQLSRPQVVKKLWEYIHALKLQDPNDKRQIICDDRMYAVFRQDKVHMFTMNKLLGKQLYPVDELQD